MSNHSFTDEVRVRFVVQTAEGLEEVTNSESLKRSLKKAVPNKTRIRAQDWTPYILGQHFVQNDDGKIHRVRDDNQTNFQAYNTKSSKILGFGATSETLSPNLGRESGAESITYRYFPPSTSDGLTLTSLSAGVQEIPESDSPVIVRIDYNWRPHPNPSDNSDALTSFQVFVNGESYFSVVDYEQPGNGTASVLLPFFPIFGSTSSGDFRIEVEGTDPLSSPAFAEYIQRGLALQEELLDYDLPINGSVTITNSIAWDYGTDRNTLEQPSWEIEILDPSENVVESFTGDTPQIGATWDSSSLGLEEAIRLKPVERAAPNDGPPVYSYRIKAKALAFSKTYPNSSYYNGPAIFYEVSSDDVSGELRIVNTKVTPENPFEDGGNTATVKADIIGIGIEGLTEDKVVWDIDIKDSDGNVVLEDFATGTGYEVEAVWDGTIEGQAVDDPAAYQYCINAKACTGGEPALRSVEGVRGQEIPGERCYLAHEDGAFGEAKPKIDIKRQRRTLGTSLDNPEDLTEAGVFRLSQVHELDLWEVTVSGLKFDGPSTGRPSSIEVSLESSGSKDNLILNHDSSGTTGEVYKGVLTQTDAVLSKEPDNTFIYNEINGIQDDKDFGAEVSEKDASEFNSLFTSLSLSLSLPFYPYDRAKRLGILEYLPEAQADRSSRLIPTGRALGDRTNFRKFGFEDVDFTFEDNRFSNSSDQISATVKTQNKAAFVYSVVHGGKEGGLQLTTIDGNGNWAPDIFFPRSLQTEDVAGLRTLALVSCAALATNDYNNQITSATTPLEQRPKGGLNWWEATRQTINSTQGTVLLGYNVTLMRLYARGGTPLYFSELKRLKAAGVDDSVVQQYAWLAAHRLFAGQGHFACALDDEYYYYISYDRDEGVWDDPKIKFVRVPLANIESVQTGPYSSYKKGVPSGAEDFTIPGVPL